MIALNDLRELPGGTVRQLGGERFEDVRFDSRALRPGDLFVALRGSRDGHDFIPDAIDRGAAGLLVSRPVLAPEGISVVEVPDTLIALQDLAAAARQRFAGPVIAITGSVGKTTTKAMTSAVLRANHDAYANEASFNNHIGVPLTLLGIAPHHTHVVSEIGTNHPGEIDALAHLVDPDIAALTTVGYAHIGNFTSRKELATEKTDLLRRVRHGGHWIVNIDDPLIREQLAEIRRPDVTSTTISLCSAADLQAHDIKTSETGTTGFVRADVSDHPFALPVTGRHFVYSALIALAIGRRCEVSIRDGIAALSAMPAPAGRAELRRMGARLLVVDDTYNASPDATLAALDLLDELPGDTKIAALGEMRELGDHSDDLHRVVGERAAEVADYLYVVGEAASPLLGAASGRGLDVSDALRPSAAEVAGAVRDRITKSVGSVVVLGKGARFMHMERIPLALSGVEVACSLPLCTLYINCSRCERVTTG